LKGKTVAVQEYGVPNPELIDGLKGRGADVLCVPVYRWALPDDTGPMKEAIRRILDGKADVALFTTAVQIEHVLKVAGQMDLAGAGLVPAQGRPQGSPLHRAFKKIVVASVGPDCSEALRSHGIEPDIEPESPKMGPLVLAVAQKAREVLSAKRLRETKPFMAICKDPALSAEIAVTAQRAIGADAAIVFSDILLILEPMGLSLDYPKGDGPSIANPVRAVADVEAVRETRRRLEPSVPLIGFAAAPFTLASYMVEGGSSTFFSRTKEFMKEDWVRWDVLMRKIVDSTARYLASQVSCGAQAVQVFDTWAGALDEAEYRRFAMPYTKELIRKCHSRESGNPVDPRLRGDDNVPVIHFGTGTSAFLEAFAEAGGDVIGVDHRVRLGEAWRRIGRERAIQGNLDPKFLLGGGAAMEVEVRRILEEAGGRAGHIFNLGHGVLPQTPFENVKALVEMVHENSHAKIG
jgi:uroporphyrinogen decarboxylase